MRKKIFQICIPLIFLFIFLSISANSADLNLSVDKTASISPPDSSGGNRLLFKFDLPEFLKNCYIDYAELVFEVELSTAKNDGFFLMAFPLKKEWTKANTSWDFLRTEPGGDFTDTIYSVYFLTGAKSNVTLDITELVNLWMKEKLANYGIVVFCPDDTYKMVSLAQDKSSSVRIFYTKLQNP